MIHNIFLFVVLIIYQIFCPFFCLSSHCSKPNILFILADDVGREVLGCYGGTSYKTPRIDSLAESGMRFTNCHVMPVCHPTRVALLSGRYPFQLGSPEWGSFPRESEKQTVANVLKAAGYATAVAGKWQLELLKNDPQQPHRMGFDDYCLFGWHEGPRYHDPFIYQNGKKREGWEGSYGPEVYTDFLIDFMTTCEASGQPFFAFYSMALCHDVTDDLEEPVPFAPHGRYDGYGQMVDQMDRMVGKMMDAVDRLGIADETMVVFVSDNGTPALTITDYQDGKLVREPVFSKFEGRSIQGGKKELTDWGTRVPLLVSWRGRIVQGSLSEALVDSIDFMPTFMEAAESERPAEQTHDGKSFLPILRGETDRGRDWVFSGWRDRFFVRTIEWKLYHDGRLVDMVSDPEEAHPITPDGDHSNEAKGMREGLMKRIASLGLKY